MKRGGTVRGCGVMNAGESFQHADFDSLDFLSAAKGLFAGFKTWLANASCGEAR